MLMVNMWVRKERFQKKMEADHEKRNGPQGVLLDQSRAIGR